MVEMSVERVALDKVLQVVKQLLASEEHIVEVSSIYDVPDELRLEGMEIADLIRDLRRDLASELKMEEKAWCIVKHLLLAEVHLSEGLERYANLYSNDKSYGNLILKFLEALKTVMALREKIIKIYGGRNELEGKVKEDSKN